MRIVRMSMIMEDAGKRKRIVQDIMKGRLFVYPTDTLYGLGCNATMSKSVRRIRAIKTGKHPFSVIAPSKEWILENMKVSHPGYLRKIPGPYTLIMRMKRRAVCREVSVGTLGVRIPDHSFSDLVHEAGVPFVTTSANTSGETPLWNVHGIPEHIERLVDIVVDNDIIKGRPSKIIDLTGKRARVLRE